MNAVCDLVGISREGYYKDHKEREKAVAEEEAQILAYVRELRAKMPRIGTEKIQHCLRNDPNGPKIIIGRDRLFNLLRRHNLLVEPRKSQTPKTTQFDPTQKISDNLTKNLTLTGPNQVLVTDITYIRVNEGFTYLSLVTDRFTREIVGWHLSSDLTAAGPIAALKNAMKIVPPALGTIAHSDRGSQYACKDYRKTLKTFGMRSSMTEYLHCYENAAAERVNGILKQEFFLDRRFRSFKEALRDIREAIHTYNTIRPHEMLGYMTPVEARRNPEKAQPIVLIAIELSEEKLAQKSKNRSKVSKAAKAVTKVS